MVARYFTGTYGTNPWTEVEDAACLRCHEKRLLSGKVIFKNVLFDHSPHLTQLRRGKKLRCTSCHSQIVQGAHIKVTEGTCFLCHFKEAELGKGTARCTICHETPKKEIKIGTFSFNHSDVVKYDMDCLMCHAHSVEGEGNVPKERCFTCHNEPERVAEYGKITELHQIHVTEHKVECLNCHQEIYHGPPKEIEEVVKTPCSSCHLRGHSPQKDLYMGIGGKGVTPLPSVMFLSGVRCEGCHILEADKTGIKKSGPFSCMNCHGASYYKIYLEWKKAIEERVKKTEEILKKAKKIIGTSKLLNDAYYNLNLVKKGHGIHNVLYSEMLLSKSIEFVNEELKKKGKKPFEKPFRTLSPSYKVCIRCHYGIEEKIKDFFGIKFKHYVHVSGKKFDCLVCHNENPEGKPHMMTKFKTKKDCFKCHHRKKIKRKCISCHTDILKRALAFKDKKFSHSLHYKEMDISCNDCHSESGALKKNFCTECH